MRLKRNEMITVYLFTASVFLAGLWRFANEETLSMLKHDSDRINEYSIVAESLVYYEDSTDVFSSVSVFSDSALPLASGDLTSDFGYRTDPFGTSSSVDFHNGTDIAVPLNTEVFSVLDGTVIAAEYDSVGGNFIRISHGNGFESYYGHLAQINVYEGEKVTVGQTIGLSGESGKVTGPHLHFGLYYNGNPIDPDVYLDIEKYAEHTEQ